MTLHYKQRDEARRLFTEENWSIAELENKYKCKMSTYIIPNWMREDRAEKERARKQRITNNKRKLLAEKRRIEREKLKKERSRPLSKSDGEKVLAIADKHCINKDYKTDDKSKMINNFLMRAW